MNKDELAKLEIFGYDELLQILDCLIAEDGCEWDKAQTHESIRSNMIEEAYEAVDAIDNNDKDNLIEELGDVLLQAVFHGKIAQKSGEFDCESIIDRLCKKLVFRHPHVFGNTVATNKIEALSNWEKQKMQEHEHITLADKLNSIPNSFPQTLRAVKIAKNAQKAKIGTGATVDVYKDVIGDRLKNIESLASRSDKEKAIGECMFALSNLAKKLDVDAEIATKTVNDGYVARFANVEKVFRDSGKSIFDATQDEINTALVRVIYAEVKK